MPIFEICYMFTIHQCQLIDSSHKQFCFFSHWEVHVAGPVTIPPIVTRWRNSSGINPYFKILCLIEKYFVLPTAKMVYGWIFPEPIYLWMKHQFLINVMSSWHEIIHHNNRYYAINVFVTTWMTARCNKEEFFYIWTLE